MANRHKANPDLPEFLTVRQFAVLYQIGITTVSQMCKNKRLPATKIGKTWRIHNDYRQLQNIPELREGYNLREVEVAQLLECTPRNVRYLCQSGRLKFKWFNSVRRFATKDVHEAMRKRQEAPPKRGTLARPGMIDWARGQIAALDAMR